MPTVYDIIDNGFAGDMHSAEAGEIIKLGGSDKRDVHPCRSGVVFLVFMPPYQDLARIWAYQEWLLWLGSVPTSFLVLYPTYRKKNPTYCLPSPCMCT